VGSARHIWRGIRVAMAMGCAVSQEVTEPPNETFWHLANPTNRRRIAPGVEIGLSTL